MPEIIIIAGPNGAGKTSFANQYLPASQEGLVFVNADEIAREMLQSSQKSPVAFVDLKAGRAMLRFIDQLAAERREFMFETTLASRAYAGKIPAWQAAGYSVALMYLRLSSVEMSIERVRRRVDAGGHDIPEAVIRRRFARSQRNLEQIYKSIVDEWYVWDSVEGDFNLVEASNGK